MNVLCHSYRCVMSAGDESRHIQRPMNIRHPMGLRHPVSMYHFSYKCVMPYVYAMSDMQEYVKLATLKCKSSMSTMTRYIHINKNSVLQCVAVRCSVTQCVAA